jgi:putative AlgH/UPF0301 family transcriptional regulator
MGIETPVNVTREGQLLVATPFVHDSPYSRAVVLLMRHSEHGSLGLVLNTELPTELRELGEMVRSAGLPGSRLQPANSQWQLVIGFVLWPPGQLERELQRGIWISTPAQLDVSSVQRDLWSGLLRQIGRSVLQDTLHLKHFPADPGLN